MYRTLKIYISKGGRMNVVHGFFSLVCIYMMASILFILIFFENKKLALRFGLVTLFITVVQFVLLNMTPLSNTVKDIIMVITILLLAILVTGQILTILKEEKVIERKR